jgi:multiple sugar transport system permease protein
MVFFRMHRNLDVLSKEFSFASSRIFRRSLSEAQLGVVLILPALLILGVIILYPLIDTLATSFTDSSLMRLGKTTFVGFSNYLYLLKSENFPVALKNSIVLTFSTIALQLIIGFIIALMLNKSFRGKGILRGIFILPWAVPTVVAAYIWIWILDGRYGVLNHILRILGIVETEIHWLGNPSTAMLSVIIAHTWKAMPWVVLVLLAGLKSIPEDIKEASRVDGATAWQEFWTITVPSMKYMITIVIVLRVIWIFNWFDYVYILTGGGPGNRTLTLPIETYVIAFRMLELGKAAAIAGTVFLILILFTLLFFRLRKVEEG